METTAWNAFWGTVTRFDRSKINPPVAIRNSIGVVLPMAIAGAMGQRSYGLVGALGALNVAYSDGDDAYGLRARRMVASSAVVALALLTGGVTGHYNPFAIGVAVAWAFAAGLLVALGTSAGDIGTISLVTLVIFASRPLTARQAAISGLVALGGALLQTSLSLLFWPVRRLVKERELLAEVFQELGQMATLEPSPGTAPPATATFIKAQEVLFRDDRGPEWERMCSLLSQAERIRLRLLALGRLRRRIERDEFGTPVAVTLEAFLVKCSEILNGIAVKLTENKARGDSGPPMRTAERYIDELRNRHWDGAPSSFLTPVGEAVTQLEALMGQIRAAVRLAQGKDADPPLIARTDRSAVDGWRKRIVNQSAVLRANLTMKSSAFRHALRLAVCVGVGDALGRSFDWQRTYWIPMTIAIILKPDFVSTFSRGVLRLAGTFFGLIVATVLYYLLPSGTLTDVFFVGAFTLMLRWVGPANYGIFVVAISGLVVALIANSGIPPRQVVPVRALNTLIGGVLALIAYAVWPTWERTHSGESLARLLDAYRAYLRALESSGSDFRLVDQARQSARVARSNEEASADRLRMEPGTTQEEMQLISAMLVSSHDFVYAVMAMEGTGAYEESLTRENVKRFLQQVELTLYFLSAKLRGGQAMEAGELPDLREQHRRILESSNGEDETSLVQVETDRMTNALNTLKEQIFDWLAIRARPSHR